MQINFSVPGNTALFAGVAENEIREMLHCLNPRCQDFRKDEVIFKAGDHIDSLGLMLSGSALIVQEDYWGNRNIISNVEVGDLFGESFAARPSQPLNASAVAAENCSVMFLQLRRVLTTCPTACGHHRRIIENLLAVVSEKNQRLNEKLIHIAQRSTRQKLLSYLSNQAQKANSAIFEIPFNRQELADYLSVDRSALSAELSRLKAEGLLDYHRNSFKMLKPQQKGI